MAWICIHTKPSQEVPVQDRLLDLALETLFPTRRITIPDRKRPGHSCSQTVPLFPRYLFADVDPADYFAVPSVRGVSTVVQTRTDDGFPQFLTVPLPAIAALRHTPPSLRIGQEVKLRGPYQGLFAIISSISHLDTSGQVEVWLHMLASRRIASLHYSLIQTGD